MYTPRRLMTFDQFKADLERKHGAGQVRFEEFGRHGWTSVESILDGKPVSQPGPHWCDASPRPRTGRLLASYDFVSGTAKFF